MILHYFSLENSHFSKLFHSSTVCYINVIPFISDCFSQLFNVPEFSLSQFGLNICHYVLCGIKIWPLTRSKHYGQRLQLKMSFFFLENYFARKYPFAFYFWCNGYHKIKWTRRTDFKSWTRLFAFHFILMLLLKGMNPFFSSSRYW